MTDVTARLKELGLALPQPAAAVAAYVPFVISKGHVFIAGQLPMENGKPAVTGRLGNDVDITTGTKAAQICALNILAQLNAACGGDFSKVERCVRLGVFVSSADGFFDQPKVANGASELMEKVFGPEGKHARAAVGVNALPLNAAVEVEAIFALRG
jgi:enamine deaminase RidA (YjgF/YER057c/UK114 family)